MAFSQNIKEQILVDSARHCCVCHRYKGLKIEVHHIVPQDQGGQDTYENAIALCFDCHADAGHYFAKHPKGSKFSPSELKKHKLNWIETVKCNNVEIPFNKDIDLIVLDNVLSFSPEFIEENTKFFDREKHKQLFKKLKIDYKEMLHKLKTGNSFVDHRLTKIKSLEDYLEYIFGDEMNENIDSAEEELNIQPNVYSFGIIPNGSSLSKYRTINLSICVVKLRLQNNSKDVLENFKVYLEFDNIIKADSVDKNKDEFDFYNYKYNIHFTDNNKAVFIPDDSILVQNDLVDIDTICFLTEPIETIVTINWRLVARDFNKTGQIELSIKPKVEFSECTKYVENADDYEIEKKIRFKYK